jgi:hypothetical protein
MPTECKKPALVDWLVKTIRLLADFKEVEEFLASGKIRLC